jgi:L-serine dehydratase
VGASSRRYKTALPGIVPAARHYHDKIVHGVDDDGVVRFLLTAAVVGMLREDASISGGRRRMRGRGRLGLRDGSSDLCEVLGGRPAARLRTGGA